MVKFNIIWATRKVSHYLKLKITLKILVVLYTKEFCSCGNNYIGETIRNAVTRIDKHKQPNGKSEPSKHLKNTQDINLIG